MSKLVEVNFRWKFQVIFCYCAEIFVLFNVGILDYEFGQMFLLTYQYLFS